MRAAPNATYTLLSAYGLGPPVPFYTAPCRVVLWDQIQPSAPPPFFFTIGYITIDAPYNYVAGATVMLGGRQFLYDVNFSTPVQLSTHPGQTFLIVLVDTVTTDSDNYVRLWLVDEALIP